MSDLTLLTTENQTASLAVVTAESNPFRLVVDPKMRTLLRESLLRMIDHHDERLADFFASGQLALDSYKEYIELFARSLRETMETPQGVAYLLDAAGFDVPIEEINLNPEWRWKEIPATETGVASEPEVVIPQV